MQGTNGLPEMTQEKRTSTTANGQKQKLTAHHRVLNLNVTGGFLSGVHLEFADGLNCLIGGRGAGKTTVLEFLRFGLGLMPDPRVSAARFRAIDGLVKANLGNGRLTIELRTKTDMKYTAARSVSATYPARP
jgi:AAA domain